MAFTAPTAAAFKARFPAFASVADATVTATIAEAQLYVGQNWLSQDYYTLGILYLTAHFLSSGIGSIGLGAAGNIQSVNIGPIGVQFAAVTADTDTLLTTSYGARYVELRDMNVRGPVVI